MEAAVITPETSIGMNRKNGGEGLGDEDCEDTPMYHFDILRGLASK